MNRRLLLVAVLLACLHAAVALWFCVHGLLNADEAFYGLAAREVTAGRLPYRDFGFTQTPLVPYFQGAVMRVIGFGFLEQRIAAGLWAAAAIAVGAGWLARRAGPAAAWWFAALLTLSAGWMYHIHLGKTYGVTTLAVLLLGLAFAGDRFSPRGRRIALPLLGAVVIGCRLPAAPLVAVLWLALLLEQPSLRHVLAVLTLAAAALGVTLGGFVAADPENFSFWVLEFHRESVALRNFFVVPGELWALAPALWLGAAVAAAALARGRVRLAPREAWLAGGLAAALAANLIPRGAYAEYAAPFVPLALLLVCAVLARVPALRWPLLGPAAAAVALATAFFLPPPNDPEILGQVRAAAAAVERVLPAGVELGGPATLLALETGRPVSPRLLMTPFSLTEAHDEAWAEEHHFATPRWLTARMADRALPVYALTTQRRWNFGRTMPDFALTDPELLRHWARLLERDYAGVYANGAFAIWARREAPVPPAAVSSLPPP
jgi:hypothetical protein